MREKILNFILITLFILSFGYLFVSGVSAETVPEENFIIRNGDTILFDGSVPLPDEGTVAITDSNNVEHTVDARSVLAILKNIESNSSDDFSISNLQYYDSFGSFYLKCITPTGGEELCDNWQYAVGNATPYTSIDTTILSGGETVGIYFGTSHRLVLSSDTATTEESISAKAEKYNYEDNTWEPLTGVSVGVTLPNPDDPWNPTVVATYPVDDLGVANITNTYSNTYTLGIVEDYYFPSYTLTVSEPVTPSGGGGGHEDTTPEFNAPSALAYLESVQGADGSFGDSTLYTDWVAIAFGATNSNQDTTNKILSYFENNNSLSSLLTDNERHAMALLALGQNPYSYNSVNYIEAITDEFDGTQFGDTSLVNDDIFALLPLYAAGYGLEDEMISKDISFIISKQQTNGSWENSVDVTSAAVQALRIFKSAGGADSAISQAENYLIGEQGGDGGWGNISSTSWAMQSESALGTSWEKDGKSGLDYLAEKQEDDGSVSPSTETLANRIWVTSYAIPAGLGKPWNEIMKSVSKPETEETDNSNDSSNSGNNNETETLLEENAEENPEPVAPEPVITQVVAKPKVSTIKTVSKTHIDSQEKDDSLQEIIPGPAIYPENLAAEAIDSLPWETNIPKSIPMILGTASSILLLGAVIRIFTLS